MSERITPSHLSRKALVYVRQSSLHQVRNYTESRRLQYAMKDRIRELGWREVEVIDEDQGQSASGTVARSGFERMVAEVCMGKVGAVAAREVSRFARNSREWQQLIEVCRWVDTLVVDHDTVYHPRWGNDRLLLGLKGSLNEYELDILRLRSLEARRAKAARGELIISVPIGYEKEQQRMVKTPNLRIQQAIEHVFAKFLELGTARQVLGWFLDQGMALPVRATGHGSGGDVVWRRPRYSTIARILKNPAYAGIYAYGQAQTEQVVEGGCLRKVTRRTRREEWHSFLPEHHEGYVDRTTWERIQRMMADNTTTFNNAKSTGAAKRGPALLSGLLRCRRCGRKLTVQYTGRAHTALRYACQRGHLDIGTAKCISFGGDGLDEAIGEELVRVLEPAAIQASRAVWEQVHDAGDARIGATRMELTEARYEAQRAARQYNTVDPENRLVASELETRWDSVLQRVSQLENKLENLEQEVVARPEISWEEMGFLGQQVDMLWRAPGTDPRLKKRIARTLIEEIVVDVDSVGGWIEACIHWKGGIHTEHRVRRRRRGEHPAHTKPQTCDAITVMAHILSDENIAGVLNKNGLLTGHGNRWTRERVCSFRSKRGIAPYNEETRRREGWMNLTEAAKHLGVSTLPLRKAVERGELPALHPLPVGPWVFLCSDLETETAKQLAERVKQRRKRGALQSPDQLTLMDSTTYPEEAL
jgi:DNA invertase Pin-like site-specific DNA recombinase